MAAIEPRISHNLHGIALRSLGVVCFALMSTAMKWASQDGTGPIEMLFFRAAVGLPFVLFWLNLGAGIGIVRTKRPGAHLFRAVLGVGSLAMVYQGLTLLPIADAVTIGFSAPAFGTLLSALVIKEKVGPHRWAAVAIGFIGVVIVARPGGNVLSHAGVAFTLLGALGAGATSVMIRQLGTSESHGSIVFWFFVCAGTVGAIGMPFVARAHGPLVWGALLLGGLAGAAAQLLMTKALKLAPVSVISPFDYGQIIWVALLGWMIWSSVPTGSTLLGGALIVASGLYTAWREHRLGRQDGLTSPIE